MIMDILHIFDEYFDENKFLQSGVKVIKEKLYQSAHKYKENPEY